MKIKMTLALLLAMATMLCMVAVPSARAAGTGCQDTSGALVIEKVRSNAVGTQMFGCINRSFDILSSSLAVLGSTRTQSIPYLLTSTIGALTPDGIRIASAAYFTGAVTGVAGSSWTLNDKLQVGGTFYVLNGKVGVGTNAPGYTFETSKSVNGDYVSAIKNTNASGDGLLIWGAGVSLDVKNHTGAVTVLRARADTERVGIMTATPLATLSVTGDASISGPLTVSSVTVVGNAFSVGGSTFSCSGGACAFGGNTITSVPLVAWSDPNFGWRVPLSGSAASLQAVNAGAAALVQGTIDANHLSLNPSGANVAIGESGTPTHTLQVKGAGNLFYNLGTHQLKFGDGNNSYFGFESAGAASVLKNFTTGVDFLTLNGNGSISSFNRISSQTLKLDGTAAAVHIRGAADHNIKIDSSFGAASIRARNDADNAYGSMQVDGGTLYLNANSLGAIITGSGDTTLGGALTVNGEVAIGTGVARATFTANGTLQLPAFGIQWADGSTSTSAFGSSLGLTNIQIASGTANQGVTSTTPVGITGSTVAITVSATASKVRLGGVLNLDQGSSGGCRVEVTAFRGDTSLGKVAQAYGVGVSNKIAVPVYAFDAPGAAGAYTYSLGLSSADSCTWTVEGTVAVWTFTAEEMN